MKVRALVLSALFATVVSATAQTCSNTGTTDALICAVPQLFGPGGLQLGANPKHQPHFKDSSIKTFSPLTVSIGEELSTLPLGSSGAPTTVVFDSQGHPQNVEDSLGPIITERANVIGPRSYNLGIAYQYFSFDKVDGIKLGSFPAVLLHELAANETAPSGFEHDYINTSNHVHFALNQTVLYGVFGVSKRMDASIELPFEAAQFRVTSTATIVRTQPCELAQDPGTHGGGCTVASGHDPNNFDVCGEFHYFVTLSNPTSNCAAIFNSTVNSYPSGSRSTDAMGIGDLIVRGKYQIIAGEKLAGSVGVGVRIPTGDAQNFLGSGAYGIAPFGAMSYRAKFSPHFRIGYQWNSHSVLGGDPTNGAASKASLPPGFLYSAGVDYRIIKKRLTVAADLIGERVFAANRLSLGTYPDSFGNAIPTIKTVPGADYSSDAIAVGAKVRIKGELLLIGNITMRVDNGGLRANVVPLVGLSYSF